MRTTIEVPPASVLLWSMKNWRKLWSHVQMFGKKLNREDSLSVGCTHNEDTDKVSQCSNLWKWLLKQILHFLLVFSLFFFCLDESPLSTNSDWLRRAVCCSSIQPVDGSLQVWDCKILINLRCILGGFSRWY